ncbi:hypothetical protein [Methylorubrum populi]|nr:hypothetical protein [Methylorubrum populi]
MTLDEMVEELRDEAEELARDLEGIPAAETVPGQAAQALEEFGAALARIRDGAADPQDIARAALDLSEPLKPTGTIDDTIRRLLKPRRE